MPDKSAGNKLGRRPVASPAATNEHLNDLLAAMEGPGDTSEIPESSGPARRVKRDALGRLPEGRKSPIRTAILAELERLRMTRYQLWRKAQAHCETLTASAVYEYLRGRREIGILYVEAILKTLDLVVGPRKVAAAKPSAKALAGATKITEAATDIMSKSAMAAASVAIKEKAVTVKAAALKRGRSKLPVE